MRDPLYKKILEGLADPQLDWKKLEECACDLLRDVFPGLVPIGGSGDFGMDGAIADGEGEAYPLVCTTAKDVIRNLTCNLDRYLQRRWPSPKVAVATSRALTPRRRVNLELRARQKGFVLLQIFDQRALANLLYRDSKWRRDLLGIIGEPPALTPVPRSRRPLVEIAPLAREADVEWLKTTRGDRVLGGQPGSGKTYLLYHLIHRLRWSALFLDVDSGRSEIMDALSDLRPEVVIVDDAHVYHEALERLIRLRAQLDTSFSIVATTWPSGTERVVESLGGAVPVRTLELLTRREIQAVIRQMGVTVAGDGIGITIPDENMRDLIDQSANRPGLAVTLAHLIRQGSYQAVLDGSALSRTLLHDYRSQSHARPLLAALGLGGDRGMRLEDASEYLGIGLSDANEIAGDLLAGLGVLQDRETLLPPMLRDPGGATLSVWPRPLRYQLVGSFYFESPRHDYRTLLGKASSRADGISTLLHAKARGAEISTRELCELVQSERNLDLWKLLAHLGQDEARWTLEHYPGNFLEIAQEVLDTAPEAALDRILDKAAATAGEDRPQPDPWEILRKWVSELNRPVERWLRRRGLLARAALAFQARDRAVGVAALFVALDPALYGISVDPADGDTVTLRWGLLPRSQLEALLEIWRRARPRLIAIEAAAWPHAERTLWDWIHPEGAAKGPVAEETRVFMREIAAAILRDLPPLVANSPGLTLRLGQVARRCGIDIELEVDPIFELLYAGFDEVGPKREEAAAARLDVIRHLARQWRARPADEVAAQLAHYEEEARKAKLALAGSFSERFAQDLAQEVTDPAAWFEALSARGLAALAAAFTERIVFTREHGWEEHLGRCFELALPFRYAAAEQVLQMPEPPRQLMDRAARVAEELPRLVETLALRRLLPVANLRFLLHHPARQVALAAAVGECNVGGSGTYTERVREEVGDDWRQAILGARGADYDKEDVAGLGSWLPAILRSDPQLALDWLERRLSEPDLPGWFDENGAFARAAQALGRSQRGQLLAQLPDCPIAGPLVRCLVEKDPALFQCLLARSELRSHHLEPLRGSPDEAWCVLASMALDAGYTPEDIAKATGPSSPGGPELATLADHPDPRLREVARCHQAFAVPRTAQIADQRRGAVLKGSLL